MGFLVQAANALGGGGGGGGDPGLSRTPTPSGQPQGMNAPRNPPPTPPIGAAPPPPATLPPIGIAAQTALGAPHTPPGTVDSYRYADNTPVPGLPYTPGGTPVPQPGGWADLTQPGVGEQAYDRNAPALATPGAAETQWDAVSGLFGAAPSASESYTMNAIPGLTAPGAGQDFITGALAQGGPGQAQDAYQAFLDQAGEPGLDAYYDNQRRRAIEAIDQQSAARGQYGSSAALDVGQEAITNLAAAQANREADYNLDRLGLGGQLAGQAAGTDLASTLGLGQLGLGGDTLGLTKGMAGIQAARGAQQDQMSRLGVGGQLAGGAQGAQMSRILQDILGASGAQGLQEGRIGGGFQDILGLGATAFPGVLGAQGDIPGQDVALFGGGAGAQAGATGTDVAEAERQRAQNEAGFAALMEMFEQYSMGAPPA